MPGRPAEPQLTASLLFSLLSGQSLSSKLEQFVKMGDEGSRKITKNTHDKFSVEQDGSFKMIPKRADKKDMKAWKKKKERGK